MEQMVKDPKFGDGSRKRQFLEKRKRCVRCVASITPIMVAQQTNLHEHLNSKHALVYTRKVKSVGTDDNDTPCSDTRAKEITSKLADMISLDLRPVNMVEGEGLCIIHYFEPGYKIPCRKHFSANSMSWASKSLRKS